MTDTFRAYIVDEVDGVHTGGFRQLTPNELPKEDVLVDVSYSSLNYKDGLAVTGKGKVIRRYPMVPGVDFVGTVLESDSQAIRAGDQVVAMGQGLSETLWGGYSKRMRVNAEILTKISAAFSPMQVMAIGTAGYTAMLSVMAMEHNGLAPEKGEVLVTGAAGGVGSVAIALLAKLGYRVVASTGRLEEEIYLRSLGALEIISRDQLDQQPKPLEKARWVGVIDTVGSKTLAMAIAQTKDEGVVTACGLAGGTDLPTTVMPFILRAVKLVGIHYCPHSPALREAAWTRLARDLDLAKLAFVTTVEPLSQIASLAEAIVQGKIRGRVVIDVNA